MPVAKFKLKDGKKWAGEISYNLETISIGGKKQKQFRLDLIYVKPEYRHKGFGTKIMNHIIERARKLGCKRITINLTREDYDYYSTYKERRRFFEKFGFKFDKEGRHGRLRLYKEDNKTIEPLKFKSDGKIVEIRSLEELLDILIKIPQDKVDEVIKSNVSKTSNPIADWVEKTYPNMIFLHTKLRDIKNYTPQQIREHMIRSLRSLRKIH